MKNVLKAANFKGFAVSETPRKALRCETCGAPRGGKQSGLSAGKLPAGGGFSFQALFAFLFFPAGKRGLLFSAGMIFCFAGCARAQARFFVSRFGAGLRREERPPVLLRFGGAAARRFLAALNLPRPRLAVLVLRQGGSVAYSFSEKSLLCKSFSEALFYFVFRVVLAAFSRRVLLDCGARVRSAKVCGASVAA